MSRSVTPAGERTIALVVVGLAGLALAAGLLLGPIRYMSVDEAKYLGIGVNLLAGRGPLTVFDVFFPYHAPLWPAMVVAPQAWFGLDASAWAHVMNVASALLILAVTAWLGWRIRPILGALAATVLIGFAYFVSLGRTLGLDLPAASLTLAYVAIGITAVRRGSVPLALAAGATFAAAFLVKEIALPFAPLPFLAGLVAGRSPGQVARLAACAMVVGLLGSSWWFMLFASETGEVYRLGTPAWTLGPLAVGAGALAILGWFAPRILVGRLDAGRRATIAAGWAATVAWLIVLTGFFAYTRLSVGQSFLGPAQVAKYVTTWSGDLWLVLAVGVVGGVGGGLALAERIRRARDGRDDHSAADDAWTSGVDDLLVATLCGLPLVLLVISVGELPRHYIAQTAVLMVLGAAGWLQLLDRVLRRPDRITLVLAGLAVVGAAAVFLPVLPDPPAYRLALSGLALAGLAVVLVGPLRRRLTRLASIAPAALAFVTLAGAIAVLAATTFRGPTIGDQSKARAVETSAAWIRANVPEGSPIAFNALLAYETADQVQGRYRIAQVSESQSVVFDASAPLGLVRRGSAPTPDWIAVDTSPNVAALFYGYEAGPLQRELAGTGSVIWVVSTITGGKSAIPLVPALEHAQGLRILAHWTWPYAPGTLETYIFGVEPADLSFGGDRLYISQAALSGLIDLLRESGEDGHAAARGLAARIVVVPDNAAGRALQSQLEALVGP